MRHIHYAFEKNALSDIECSLFFLGESSSRNFVNGVIDNLDLYCQQWDNIEPLTQNSVI